MSGLIRSLIYLWAMPTTLPGLPFVLAAWLGGGRVRFVRGVAEVHGKWIAGALRWVPISGGASAMTLGHIVIGRDAECLERTRGHERVHVRQAERWGPLFIPAYLFLSVLVYCRGGRAYEDNPFEREAYGAERA